MKKVALALILTLTATSALADRDDFRGGYRGGHYENHYHGGGGGWIAPLIIGGAVGYVLAQPRQPQTVIVQQQPQVIYQQSNGPCPYPYSPYYNVIWTYDPNGNPIQTEQFAGCH